MRGNHGGQAVDEPVENPYPPLSENGRPGAPPPGSFVGILRSVSQAVLAGIEVLRLG